MTDEKVPDAEAEKERFMAAVDRAKAQLTRLYDDALQNVGEDHAAIFDVHRMLLEDEDYLETAAGEIEKGYNAVYAVDQAGTQFAELFAAMDDEYMRGRAADIRDISQRVIRILLDLPEEEINSEEPVVLVAEDLTPSETVKLDKKKILGFVTVKGSANSHTAILARSMSLPALVNVNIDLSDGLHGKSCVVDGFEGEFLVEPEEEILSEKVVRKNQWVADLEALEKLKGQDNVTQSGKRIDVFANIGNVADADMACAADAGGNRAFQERVSLSGQKHFSVGGGTVYEL